MTEATYCVRHPTTETSISCGRCGDAVCHRCVLHAPGGQRCPDCAQSKPSPTFDVPLPFIARGLGAGLGIALVGGILVSLVINLIKKFDLPDSVFFIATAALVALLGYLIGEGISLAVNRKRGKRLKIVAAVSMFVIITVVNIVTGGASSNTLVIIVAFLSFYTALKKF
jgi:hypothetical protein